MVTSHDIARAAGLSQPTVSRALRGLPGVAPETIRRVREIAAQLNYVPSAAGRNLSTRRTGCVGIVAQHLTNPYFGQLVDDLRAELQAQGYRTLLYPEAPDSPGQVDRLSDGTLDGVLITTVPVDSALPARLTERDVPFVLVNRTVSDSAYDSCVVDGRAAGATLADLIADLGHTRIAALFGPCDISPVLEREAGLRHRLRSRGLSLAPGLVRHGAMGHARGRAAALELLGLEEPPTAIVCGADDIALGAINAAVHLGLLPGRDVCVVGFDDIEMSSWDVFRLTTVRSDLPQMAQHAVRILLRRLEDRTRPAEQVVITPELILRESHCAPATTS